MVQEFQNLKSPIKRIQILLIGTGRHTKTHEENILIFIIKQFSERLSQLDLSSFVECR